MVFFGVNALLKSLHSNPQRYARQIARLLPTHRFTILGYASSRYADIVADMAVAVAAPPDVVMGISFGGFVAMRFAALHPHLAPRLVLLVSAHRFSAAGASRIERQFAALRRNDLQTFLGENATLFRRPWYNWLVRLKLRRHSLEGYRQASAILADYEQLLGREPEENADYCRRIQCPTLVVGAEKDQLFGGSVLEETARLICDAQLRIFQNETHMLPIENGAGVAAVLKTFLA
ncbi:MAG: alpha/beta hydrolase [Acidobacteria bacterium]|nr:alpha/beta hydrolase [Acidobacteriota bacterium]